MQSSLPAYMAFGSAIITPTIVWDCCRLRVRVHIDGLHSFICLTVEFCGLQPDARLVVICPSTVQAWIIEVLFEHDCKISELTPR
jgi:hypothetical protein